VILLSSNRDPQNDLLAKSLIFSVIRFHEAAEPPGRLVIDTPPLRVKPRSIRAPFAWLESIFMAWVSSAALHVVETTFCCGFDSFRARQLFSMGCPRKSPHGRTFDVVLKRLDLARIGSKRTAHLWHTYQKN